LYTVLARYYSDKDNLGETYVLKSDNGEADLKLEVGQKIKIIKDEASTKRCADL